MTDDFERRLRGVLRDAVAERGYRLDRATSARQRGQRTRHTVWGAAAAVVAVVVAAAVVPSVLANPGSDQQSGNPTTTSRTARLPVMPNQCPKVTAATPPTPGARVPGGAVRVSLCPGPSTINAVPPVDALTTNLDRLTHLVNTLSKAPRHPRCTTTREPAYTIIFHYADRHAVSVRGYLATCQTVQVGTTNRSGAKRLLQAYTMALVDQRAHTTRPATVGDTASVLSCPTSIDDAPRSILQFAFGQVFASPHRIFHVPLARAEICQLPGTTGRTRSGVLTATQVQRVNTDLAAHFRGRPLGGWACQGPATGPAGPRVLVALTSWGDPFIWSSTECGQAYRITKGVFWRPSDDVAKMLGSLLAD